MMEFGVRQVKTQQTHTTFVESSHLLPNTNFHLLSFPDSGKSVCWIVSNVSEANVNEKK